MEVFVLCVMYMCIWSGICLCLLDMQGHGLSCGRFVSLICVSPCSCVRCLVFHACCSFCVFVFWCLVMSFLVGMRSLISHCDQCMCHDSFILVDNYPTFAHYFPSLHSLRSQDGYLGICINSQVYLPLLPAISISHPHHQIGRAHV